MAFKVPDELLKGVANSLKGLEKQSCALANRSAEYFDMCTESTFNMECVVSIAQSVHDSGKAKQPAKPSEIPESARNCVEEVEISGQKVLRFVGKPVIWDDLVNEASAHAHTAISKAKQFPPKISAGSPRAKLPAEHQPLFEGLHEYRKVVKQGFRSLRSGNHVGFVEHAVADPAARSLKELIKQQPTLTMESIRSSLVQLHPHLAGIAEEALLVVLNASLKLDRMAADSNKSARSLIGGTTRGALNKKKQRHVQHK